jgi:mono/diheme cytochrome c family protein
MKTFFAIIASLILVVALAGTAAAADAAAGKEVYSKKCASCHGAAGEGRDTVAKTLKVELKHLGSKEVQAKTDAELKKEATEGVGKMKPVTGIDAKAADNLVAYLRTLKK